MSGCGQVGVVMMNTIWLPTPLYIYTQNWSVYLPAGCCSSVAEHFCIKQVVLGSFPVTAKHFLNLYCLKNRLVKEGESNCIIVCY